MPFNPETDAHLTISKEHREMLRAIAKEQRRDMRATVELMIEDEAGDIRFIVTKELPKPPGLQDAIDKIVGKS